MLHMVNTHRKFPVDSKHNAYYAADGSDVRNATKEEIKKYRLAALHKRKKPDVDVPVGKNGSSTSAVRADKYETDSPVKRDQKSRGKDSSRDRERDGGSRNREAEMKDGRTSSRDARKEKDTSTAERRRTDDKKDEKSKDKDMSFVERRTSDGKRDERASGKDTSSKERRKTETKMDEREKEKGTSSAERNRKRKKEDEARKKERRVSEHIEKKRGQYTGLDELGEEERDMRNMAEIQRRIEGRRLAKELEHSRAKKEELEKSKSTLPSTIRAERSQKTDTSIPEVTGLVGERGVLTTMSQTPCELMAADIEQRERAREWASGSTSDTTLVTQSTTDRVSLRQKAVKKAADKAMSKEVAQSLANQEAIASQYPPIIDESVSSTVRLGRALVSSAMGKRNEDPKIFEAMVELQECSVVLHSTKRKAKVPVSAPPPNSIDSDVEGGDQDDVRMSQSTTDTSVNIDLPGCAPEMIEEEMDVDSRRDSTTASENNRPKKNVDGKMCTAAAEQFIPDKPTAPGTIATPVLSMSEDVERTSAIRETPRVKATGDLVVEIPSTSGGAKEMRPDERRRILRDVDKAAIMREEIAKTNPEFASVSSFLGTVCGESRMIVKDGMSVESGVEETSAEGGNGT